MRKYGNLANHSVHRLQAEDGIGVHLLMDRIDPKAEAMRREGRTAALVEHNEVIPKRGIIAARQIGRPRRVTPIDPPVRGWLAPGLTQP